MISAEKKHEPAYVGLICYLTFCELLLITAIKESYHELFEQEVYGSAGCVALSVVLIAWYLRSSNGKGVVYRTAPIKRGDLLSAISATRDR